MYGKSCKRLLPSPERLHVAKSAAHIATPTKITPPPRMRRALGGTSDILYFEHKKKIRKK
jgi:hypothetical protein